MHAGAQMMARRMQAMTCSWLQRRALSAAWAGKERHNILGETAVHPENWYKSWLRRTLACTRRTRSMERSECPVLFSDVARHKDMSKTACQVAIIVWIGNLFCLKEKNTLTFWHHIACDRCSHPVLGQFVCTGANLHVSFCSKLSFVQLFNCEGAARDQPEAARGERQASDRVISFPKLLTSVFRFQQPLPLCKPSLTNEPILSELWQIRYNAIRLTFSKGQGALSLVRLAT